MAKLTEREVVILVKALGLDKAIAGFGTLDKGIKQTQKSSGELDRNMKGSANITSNTTKAFAKQAQGLGGLVHVYATVAANVFALSSAFNVLKSNADLKIMEQASRQLSIASGTNFNLVAKSLKDVTGGAISMKEAMQTATLGLRGGATSVQLQQITEVATKAAKALGRSVPEAVTRLTQAVIKGEPELADEFGIILRVEEATKKYAATLGKTVSSMTTFERQQAIINQAIEQGQKKYGELKLDSNPYDKLAATFTELTQSILQFISIPLGSFFGMFAENTNLMVLAILAFSKAVAQRAIPEIFKLGNAMIESSKKASANAIAAYQAEQHSIENLIKSKEKLAAISSFKATQAKGTIKELKVVDNIPGIKKALEANLQPAEIARAFYKSLYSQIDREAKKFGGDVSKVVAANIRNPIQKEFLALQQQYLKLGKGMPSDQILGQLRGVDVTKQQFLALQNIIKVYSLELQNGVKASEALANASRALAASGLNLGNMWDSLKLKASGVTQGYNTFKVAMQVASQAVIAGEMKNLKHAESLALLKAKLAAVGIETDKLNPKMLELGLSFGKFTGSIANGIAKIGSFVGSAFNAIMVITLLWEGLKILSNWLGITNSKISAVTESLTDFQKDIDITTDAIYAYKKSVSEAAFDTLSLQEAIETLGRKAAVFDSLATAADKFAKKLREIGREGGESGFWRVLGLVGAETDTKTAISKAFKTQLAQAAEMLGEVPKILSDSAGRLVTPGSIIKPMLDTMLDVSAWKYSAGDIKKATTDLLNSAYEAAGGVIVDQSGKLSEKFLFHMNNMIKNDSAYKVIEENYGAFVQRLEEAGAQAVLKALDDIEAGTVIQKITDELNNSSIVTDEMAYKVAALTAIIRDAEKAAGNFANVQKSGLEDFSSALKSVNTDLDNYIKNFSAGTEAAIDKSSIKVIEMATKLQEAISKIPQDVDPFKYLMQNAPEVTRFFNLTKENANTVAKAQETLAKYAVEQLQSLNKQTKLQTELTAAEVQLGIAKRNNALVDSKNFAEKKKAIDLQYDAELRVLDKQIEIQEEQIKVINKRNEELILISRSILELEKKRIAEQNITGAIAEQLVLRAQEGLLKAQEGADKAKAEAEATLAGLKEKRNALAGQRGQALAGVDRKAASAGESATDKAQAQAEKIANLEASIAKKRLERGAMFLALEKELGDAVESRMEWELTGAREAVGLGNKRLAILSREYSMSQALIPLKKAAMEAEARALEIKADGLEKDGEIKAAEEARLEVANKRQEMNNLDIEYVTLRLEYEQKLYDVALKQHDLRKRAMIPTFKEGSGIQGSEEFFQSAKVEFALRWDKFMDEMTSPVDRLLDAFEGAIDSGVDAFVEAIANGENALQAAGEAIKKTIFELAKEWLKEDIKSLLYATVGSALGMEDPKEALKSELAKMSAQDKMQHTEVTGKMDSQIQLVSRSNDLLGQIATNTATQGSAGFGNIAGQMSNMFGMNQQQFTNVSAGLEGLFDQRPDLFGSNAGLSGQIDSMFAAQPDIFGAAPGYTSAFSGTTPSFGLGGLGTSFMNMFGTAPTPATQPLGSSDIFSGSNPLGMSAGSMLNMTGMGGVLGPTSALTTGAASMGQSLLPSTMGQPTGMGAGVPQASIGGIGGMGAGLGIGSMMMSFLPMLMGGIGGGSPAGQAAKEKSSSDQALGESGGGSESSLEDIKDETKELKDKTTELLTKIKEDVLEIKLNSIEFQIEHMEKIDKNFTTWLATFMLAQMQNLMIFTMMVGLLQQIVAQLMVHTQLLSQISGCACSGGMGMAKGGIVSGLIRGYKKGAITTGPELAMIGEGANREAIVPLPDNRSIPVTLTNQEEKDNYDETNPVYNITINGVEGTEKGLKRSAGQIAYEVDRLRRNKLARF